MAVITQVQAPVQTNGTSNPLVFTFGSTPTAGNIVVVVASNSTAGHITITNTLGLNGAAATSNLVPGLSDIPTVGSNRVYSMWWILVGTNPSTTISIGNFDGANDEVDAGEYSSSDAGTWQVDGTAVTASGTSTTPNGGNITTTGHSLIYCRGVTVSGGTMTAGAGYTRAFTGAPGTNREAQEWGEFDSTTNATNWTMAASADWLVLASAFVKASGFTAVTRRSTGPRVGSRSYY